MASRMSGEKQIVAALVLVTVAILGYLAGHGGSTTAPADTTREASNAVTLVNYAPVSGWRPASGAPSIPGLSIAQPVLLAPNGDAAHGGLIVGQLGDEPSPLPERFLERLSRLPSTEVVQLLNTQAYRYSQLTVKGSDRRLTLYAIPGSATAVTAIVCYASAGFSSYLRTCEQLAPTLAIATGRPQVEVQAYDSLTPEADYGRQLRAAVGRVDGLLATLRPEIRPGASRVAVAGVARRLADGLDSAARSLSGVPPPAARRAHVALTESLRQARAAYLSLGAAVGAGSTLAYDAARTQIYLAEAGISVALKKLTLLGYK
jgi:hypothetical protein